MNWNWFQETLGEYLNKLILWAKEEKKRFVFFVLILFIFSFIVIPAISQYLRNFNYAGFLTSLWSSFYESSNSKESVAVLFGIVLLMLLKEIIQIVKYSKRVFEINIAKQSDLWSYYKGSGWSIVEDSQSWNKVLKITNCHYPAILKVGNEWVNYNFSFEAKVPSDVAKPHRNFTFVIRARDKGNNVFFQCKPEGIITPHFITNGLFLVDKTNEIKFLTEYPLDKWIPVEVGVKGSDVTIAMLGVSTVYKIPSMRLVLPGESIRAVMTLEEAEKFSKESSKNSSGGNGQPQILAFDLDYEKGTIGFREYGEETALFRKIKVEQT